MNHSYGIEGGLEAVKIAFVCYKMKTWGLCYISITKDQSMSRNVIAELFICQQLPHWQTQQLESYVGLWKGGIFQNRDTLTLRITKTRAQWYCFLGNVSLFLCLSTCRTQWIFPQTRWRSSVSMTTRRSGIWSVIRWVFCYFMFFVSHHDFLPG